MRVARYTDTANDGFARLSPDQRRAVIRIVAHAQIDPTPDNIAKFTLYELGAMYTIHRDFRGHYAVYYVEGDLINVMVVGINPPYGVPSSE